MEERVYDDIGKISFLRLIFIYRKNYIWIYYFLFIYGIDCIIFRKKIL